MRLVEISCYHVAIMALCSLYCSLESCPLLVHSLQALESFCNPIVNIPKPKVDPPKDDKKEEGKKEAGDGGAKEEGTQPAASSETGAEDPTQNSTTAAAEEMDVD